MSDEKVVPFVDKHKKKLDLLPGAESPDDVWECPCTSRDFNLRADYQIECSACGLISPFKYYDPRLL